MTDTVVLKVVDLDPLRRRERKMQGFGGSLATVNDLKDWLPFIANLVVAGVIYGGMWADVRNVKQALRDHNALNNSDFAELQKSDSRQWDRIEEHGQRLTKVETVLEVRGRGVGGSS